MPVLPVPVANHIRKHAIRARHAGAQLPVPNHAGIDVIPFAKRRHQQPALSDTARPGRSSKRARCNVNPIPSDSRVRAPESNSKVRRRDPVRSIQQWMTRQENTDRSCFVRYAFVTKHQGIRRQLRSISVCVGIPFVRFVIEDNQRPARLGKI